LASALAPETLQYIKVAFASKVLVLAAPRDSLILPLFLELGKLLTIKKI